MNFLLKKNIKTILRLSSHRNTGNQKPRKQKNIIPENYIKTTTDTKPHIVTTLSELIKKSEKYDPKNPKKGLKPTEEPIPVSPILGPIKVQRPKVGQKLFWCSCGMSSKQPYCDGSHRLTAFKPIEFVVEEPVEWAFYCGCKLSEDKPFCDGKTCLEIQGINVGDSN